MSKPPLAIFTPLPPSKSGIADYCYEQLPLLSRDWDVSVVVAKKARGTPIMPEGVEVVALKDWLADEERDYRTPRLYHMGNNTHHEYVFEEALRRPGVVMLHDFVLHHLVTELTLARGDERGYRDYMERDHGRLGGAVARQRERYVFSEFQQFWMPLNGSILDNAQGVIVHSTWSERRVRERLGDRPVARVPHHFSPPGPDVVAEDRAEARSLMRMDPGKLIFMCIGFVTPPKRVDLTIRALSRIADRLPPFELWLVGEAWDNVALDRMLVEHKMKDRTRLTGYVALERFQLAIQASDVIVNLRYPTAGETSGTLVRAMGMGRACVVFDYASFADYPDAVATKIPLQTTSTAGLERALLELGSDPARRESLGRRASDHVRAMHALPRCVNLYTAFMRDVWNLDR